MGEKYKQWKQKVIETFNYFFLEKMRSTVLTYIFRTLLVLANCVTDLKEEEQ